MMVQGQARGYARRRPWRSSPWRAAHVLALLFVAGCGPSLPTPVVYPIAPAARIVPDPRGEAGVERTFTAQDGATLGLMSHTSTAARTALVYLHGIESHAGWFAIAATMLRDRGYDVFSLDRRGSGINRENRGFVSGHVESYDVLLADIRAFVRPLRKRYDAVFLVGLSWGGKLALGYGLKHPEDVDGLVLITPGIRSLVDVDLITKLGIFVSSWLRPTAPFASPIKPEMFTVTPRFLAYIRRDPLRLRHTSARFLMESHRLECFIDGQMPRSRLHILLFLAGRDRIIDNEGVREVLRQGQGMVDLRIYEEQTHSIQFDTPGRLVRDMVDWLVQMRP